MRSDPNEHVCPNNGVDLSRGSQDSSVTSLQTQNNECNAKLAYYKAREEAEEKAREKAREEEERKAREEAEKKLREEEVKKAQAEEKAREDARVAARERHAAVRKERERKLREAAAALVNPKPSSVISSFRPEDDDREGPSHKRSHSNGPGSNVPEVIITKKKRKASPINVDEMEDADDFMEIRGSCDNCEKRSLRCFPQSRSGPNSACAPCNKSKLGCSWVRKRTNQSKAEKARTASAVPDSSQIVPDLLRTIIGQNEALLTYNRGILHQMKILNEIINSGTGVEEGEVAQAGVNAGESEVPKDDLLDFGDYVTDP
ncbi:hypothetical protein GGU10DRAFT_380578 [Lentinula aff. detonsa]|uniref:Zn(2)-C6 fungal-type domain-containing protein n=1 Tax=Lentinula aff. detonsa TaxID=2804958 RepID=A0AA38L1T1_9AGAR|nr:hypothetical protein GGU10DRAFT_380578 [Lentinula aff. detonsa]